MLPCIDLLRLTTRQCRDLDLLLLGSHSQGSLDGDPALGFLLLQSRDDAKIVVAKRSGLHLAGKERELVVVRVPPLGATFVVLFQDELLPARVLHGPAGRLLCGMLFRFRGNSATHVVPTTEGPGLGQPLNVLLVHRDVLGRESRAAHGLVGLCELFLGQLSAWRLCLAEPLLRDLPQQVAAADRFYFLHGDSKAAAPGTVNDRHLLVVGALEPSPGRFGRDVARTDHRPRELLVAADERLHHLHHLCWRLGERRLAVARIRGQSCFRHLCV